MAQQPNLNNGRVNCALTLQAPPSSRPGSAGEFCPYPCETQPAVGPVFQTDALELQEVSQSAGIGQPNAVRTFFEGPKRRYSFPPPILLLGDLNARSLIRVPDHPAGFGPALLHCTPQGRAARREPGRFHRPPSSAVPTLALADREGAPAKADGRAEPRPQNTHPGIGALSGRAKILLPFDGEGTVFLP